MNIKNNTLNACKTSIMLLVSPFIRNAIFKVVSCTLLQLKHMLLPINLTTIIASSQKRNFGLSILVENWNLIISLSPQTISNPFEDRLQMKQVIYCRFMKTRHQFMRISEYYRIWTILILEYYKLLQLFYLIANCIFKLLFYILLMYVVYNLANIATNL